MSSMSIDWFELGEWGAAGGEGADMLAALICCCPCPGPVMECESGKDEK